MKKCILYGFTVAFTLWFLVAGVGYNIIKCCCSGCFASGVDAYGQVAVCCAQDEKNDEDKPAMSLVMEHECIDNQHTTEQDCELVYFKANFTTVETNKDNQLDLKNIFVLITFAFDNYFIQNKEYTPSFYALRDKISLNGRAVLSMKSVLII
ncbi:MAG: hypothetical protein LBT04_00885 [Prevotellaceae bacterium]|jgi:hypothetical protein|nr:hypothetical protein [Prevotellaceae bacterium]